MDSACFIRSLNDILLAASLEVDLEPELDAEWDKAGAGTTCLEGLNLNLDLIGCGGGIFSLLGAVELAKDLAPCLKEEEVLGDDALCFDEVDDEEADFVLGFDLPFSASKRSRSFRLASFNRRTAGSSSGGGADDKGLEGLVVVLF
jgi:hypothetical protein